MGTLIGININLSKLDKAAIKDASGQKFINLTLSINDKPDAYGKDVSIWNEQTKDQREAKTEKSYCGNGKVLWSKSNTPTQSVTEAAVNGTVDKSDDLPF